MKKYTLAILLSFFIIPSVALASWWNPASWFNSWSFSTKTNYNTQILEERVKELEKRLQSIATSTSSMPPVISSSTTSTTSSEKVLKIEESSSQKIVSTTTVKKAVVTKPKMENFSGVLLSSTNASIKSYQELNDVIDSMIQYIDTDYETILKIKNKTQAYSDGYGGDTSTADLLIRAYNDDLRAMNEYKSSLLKLKDANNNSISIFTNYNNGLVGRLVTREEAINEIKVINADTMWQTTRDYSSKKFEQYKIYRKNTDQEYERAFAYLQGSIDKNKAASAPTYTPTVIQQIQVPQTRNTYCNVYGDTISCNSYSY